MGTPVIVDAVRTPLGKRRGWLSGVHPANLLGHALTQVLERSGLDSGEVDQVIGGCVTQAGEQSNDMVRGPGSTPGSPSAPAPPRSTRSAAPASSPHTWCTT